MYSLKIDEVCPELEKALQALIQENRMYSYKQSTPDWRGTVKIKLKCKNYASFKRAVSFLAEFYDD